MKNITFNEVINWITEAYDSGFDNCNVAYNEDLDSDAIRRMRNTSMLEAMARIGVRFGNCERIDDKDIKP